jgi:hypothetical protein
MLDFVAETIGHNLGKRFVRKIIRSLADDEFENAFFCFHDKCAALLEEKRQKFKERESALDAQHDALVSDESPYPVGAEFDALKQEEFDWWWPRYAGLRKNFIKHLIWVVNGDPRA